MTGEIFSSCLQNCEIVHQADDNRSMDDQLFRFSLQWSSAMNPVVKTCHFVPVCKLNKK